KAPLSWSVTGTNMLPTGLSLDSTSGAITGTPQSAGSSSFTVTVTDANGRTGTRVLSIAVQAALAITTTTLPDGVTGAPYNATVQAGGGKAPYTFGLASGTLPAGITLMNGALSGTPSG